MANLAESDVVLIIWPASIVMVRISRRACVLEGLEVSASLRRGYAIVRRHLREVIPVWLITFSSS